MKSIFRTIGLILLGASLLAGMLGGLHYNTTNVNKLYHHGLLWKDNHHHEQSSAKNRFAGAEQYGNPLRAGAGRPNCRRNGLLQLPARSENKAERRRLRHSQHRNNRRHGPGPGAGNRRPITGNLPTTREPGIDCRRDYSAYPTGSTRHNQLNRQNYGSGRRSRQPGDVTCKSGLTPLPSRPAS